MKYKKFSPGIPKAISKISTGNSSRLSGCDAPITESTAAFSGYDEEATKVKKLPSYGRKRQLDRNTELALEQYSA